MSGSVGDETVELAAAVSEDVDFLVAANLAMARETEGRELDPKRLRSGVERAFSDPARGRYFVARVGGERAGCLMVTREWSDWRDGWFWWIQSVWVRPELRGRGVYRSLHGHVRNLAIAAGDVVGLRLYVDRDNEVAQRTYGALGMAPTDYLLYEETFER